MAPISSESTEKQAKLTSELEDIAEPWWVCTAFARKYKDGEIEILKEEIEKVLIFAGLFSGVVASFALESYHEVKKDPAELSVLLLQTVVYQLGNLTNAQPHPDVIPQITVNRFKQQVNIIWSLSLVLALTTAMVGILCLQWIREYSSNTNLPNRENLAVRHIRYKGMVEWHVPAVVASLPLLLVFALLLFFVGFILLLQSADTTAAILVSIVAGMAFAFFITTTFAPTLQYLMIAFDPRIDPSRRSQCPWKSPQSYLLSRVLFYLIGRLWPENPCFSLPDFFDLPGWRRYDWFFLNYGADDKENQNVHVLDGLVWVASMTFENQKLTKAISDSFGELGFAEIAEYLQSRGDFPRADAVYSAALQPQNIFTADVAAQDGAQEVAEKLIYPLGNSVNDRLDSKSIDPRTRDPLASEVHNTAVGNIQNIAERPPCGSITHADSIEVKMSDAPGYIVPRLESVVEHVTVEQRATFPIPDADATVNSAGKFSIINAADINKVMCQPAPNIIIGALLLDHLRENRVQFGDTGSRTLLQIHVELYLKAHEGIQWAPGACPIKCPVNPTNADILHWEVKEKILLCINSMLKNDIQCDSTQFEALYVIIDGIMATERKLKVSASALVMGLVEETLREVLSWLRCHDRTTVFDSAEARQFRFWLVGGLVGLMWPLRGDFKEKGIIRQFLRDFMELKDPDGLPAQGYIDLTGGRLLSNRNLSN